MSLCPNACDTTGKGTSALRVGYAWDNTWSLVFTNEVDGPLDRHNVLRRDLKRVPRHIKTCRHIGYRLRINQVRDVARVHHVKSAVTLGDFYVTPPRSDGGREFVNGLYLVGVTLKQM